MNGSQILCIIWIVTAATVLCFCIRVFCSFHLKRIEWAKQVEMEKEKSNALDTTTKTRNEHELAVMDRKFKHEIDILKLKQSFLDK